MSGVYIASEETPPFTVDETIEFYERCGAAAAERKQLERVAKVNGTPVPHECAGTDPVKVVPMLLGAIGSIHTEVEQRLRCTEQSETRP